MTTAEVALGQAVERFAPISLDELESVAALQRRVDNKYLVPAGQLAAILGELRDDHRVLDIDGLRTFAYESVYFDTPELESFDDHVRGRVPRMKVRTRLYADAGSCSFEVKVKCDDGETVKEELACDVGDHGRLTADARRLVGDVRGRTVGAGPAPALEPVLVTRFRRATFVSEREEERATCDVDVVLRRPDGGAVRLRPDHALVETKTAEGEGRLDALLARRGVGSVSLSKYRTGVALLAATDPDPQLGGDLERWFPRV